MAPILVAMNPCSQKKKVLSPLPNSPLAFKPLYILFPKLASLYHCATVLLSALYDVGYLSLQ